MVVELQRRGVGKFALSDPQDDNSFLIATRHRRYPYKLGMRKRAGPRHEKKQLCLWEKDTSASNHFTNGGLFAIRLAGTSYYLSLPTDDPQAGFNMLELKLALLKPIELVCEAVQWEETDGGVIRKPAVRPRPRVIN